MKILELKKKKTTSLGLAFSIITQWFPHPCLTSVIIIINGENEFSCQSDFLPPLVSISTHTNHPQPQKNILFTKTFFCFTNSGLSKNGFNFAEPQADQAAFAPAMLPTQHDQLIQFGGSCLNPHLKKRQLQYLRQVLPAFLSPQLEIL